jgi:hypothetical protein
MKRKSFRFWVIIGLSLIVIHSGIADALRNCPHDDRADSAVSEHHHDLQGRADHGDSQEPSAPVIHCTVVSPQIGPAARTALVELTRSSKGTLLHAPSPTNVLSAVLRNDLWLEALFKRIVTFSLPIDLSRHLFLSVLRI